MSKAALTVMLTTLGSLDAQAISEQIEDGTPSARTGLIPNQEKVNRAATLAIAKVMPDVTSETLKTLDTRIRMLMAMTEAGLLKSLVETPYATVSEVKAAHKKGEVTSYVALPGGLAIALKPNGKEYRAGGAEPKHCSKHGGDAESLVFRLTRRTAGIFAKALNVADSAAKRAQEKLTATAEKTAQKAAPKVAKTLPRKAPVKRTAPAETTPA